MLTKWLLVAIGGSVGAMIRYGISVSVSRFPQCSDWPWATLIANGLGCLVMGFLVGVGLQKQSENTWLFAGVGLLGAMTTFSTFSIETIQLFMDGHWVRSGSNIVASLVVTLGFCVAGLALARSLV